MEILAKLVEALTKEEARFYKLYAQRYQTDEPRKDILLFDFYRQKISEEEIIKKMYPSGDKNAFYRIKNRLATDIFKCLVLEYFFIKDSLLPVNYYALAKLFFLRNEYILSHYLLKKAEKAALSAEDFEVLDIIYTLFIKLSHDVVIINPEIFIGKRKENYRRLQLYREIDDVLAAVDYRLKISQNYEAPQDNKLSIELLQKTVQDLSESAEVRISIKLRLKLFSALSKILLQKHDFPALEAYLLETLYQFEQEHLFKENNHEDKLKMLNFLINSLFMNGKYEESLRFTEIFGKEIEAFDKLHYDKFIFFYYNSLVINYSRLNPQKAIEILESLKENVALKQQPFYQNFIYLNLSVLYFDAKNFKKSIKELTQLYLHDSYKDMAAELKCKIAIAELIIRYQLQDEDIFLKRIEQVQKDYAKQIETQFRDREFLRLLTQLGRFRGERNKKEELKAAAQGFMKNTQASDAEIIKYNQWLQSLYPV